MRDAVLPSALLCASTGLMLGFTARRTMLAALLLLVAAALAMAQAPLDAGAAGIVFGGAAISTALTAACVYLPSAVANRAGAPMPAALALALALAVNAGGWAGALIAVSGDDATPLAWALPAALLALPAAWAVASGRAIAVKVVASWLIAVSVLAATLPIVPTPGYVSDHMQ